LPRRVASRDEQADSLINAPCPILVVILSEGRRGDRVEEPAFRLLAKGWETSNLKALFSWSALFRLDDLQALHHREVAHVEGGYGAACLDGYSRENQVVWADHLAAGLKLGPKACVLEGCLSALRHEFERRKHPLKELPPLYPMNACCALHPMP
jgi:hypothetical protein